MDEWDLVKASMLKNCPKHEYMILVLTYSSDLDLEKNATKTINQYGKTIGYDLVDIKYSTYNREDGTHYSALIILRRERSEKRLEE